MKKGTRETGYASTSRSLCAWLSRFTVQGVLLLRRMEVEIDKSAPEARGGRREKIVECVSIDDIEGTEDRPLSEGEEEGEEEEEEEEGGGL